ncbi:hypothetical protein EK904_006525 [Melospiza melodia maxima]|nr:hypothetical protein EK904_006525 [Melospiza melodia maxima]
MTTVGFASIPEGNTIHAASAAETIRKNRNVDKVIKRKKKKSKVWHKVWKVISKMLEENERFRSRLLTCSQLDGEGSDRTQRSQNGAYLDRDESIFGWV